MIIEKGKSINRTLAVSTVIGCKNFCSYCPQDKVIKAYTKRSKIISMNLEIFKICISKLPPDTINCPLP